MNKHNNKLGRWQGAGLLATTLLGTGVFILPQMTISIAGQSALISWLMLTIAIIPVTLIFAKLASMYPHAAGPAYFVEKAFGKVAGRCIGLMFLLIVPLGVPAAILITLQFVNSVIPISGGAIIVAELVILSILFLLNYRGIKISAQLQFFITLMIIAVVMVLLSLSGLQLPSAGQSLSILTLSIDPILAAAGVAFWSFLGVEAMTHLANDFNNPKKDMIPAMLIGTGLVGFIYIACTYLLLIVPVDSALSMIGVFDTLLGGYGSVVIGILGVAGGLSSANVYTASTIRLIWSFSNDGILPSYLSKKNSHNMPVNALLTLLIIMAITLAMTYFTGKHLEDLIAWCNGVFVIIYFASMMAALKLLDKSNRPLIGLGALFCVALTWGLGMKMLYAIILILTILPLLWWQRNYALAKQTTENSC
ncbi:L-methionine/branched-chain amino acid transporter [Colwelliaceae bacterium 6441]